MLQRVWYDHWMLADNGHFQLPTPFVTLWQLYDIQWRQHKTLIAWHMLIGIYCHRLSCHLSLRHFQLSASLSVITATLVKKFTIEQKIHTAHSWVIEGRSNVAVTACVRVRQNKYGEGNQDKVRMLLSRFAEGSRWKVNEISQIDVQKKASTSLHLKGTFWWKWAWHISEQWKSTMAYITCYPF